MRSRKWLMALLLVLLAGGAHAQKTNTAARIVDTAYVQEALKRGAILWDVRSAEEYQQGHLPGAVNIDHVGRALRKDSDEDYIDIGSVELVLGAAGIDPAKEVVAYGDKGNPYAYFGGLTIEHFGGKTSKVYHGGIDDWKAAGNPLVTEPTKVAPIPLHLTVNEDVLVSTQEMIRHAKRKDAQVVDVRTLGEYLGEDIRALRGGHIPGAIHIPYEQNWKDPETPAKLARRQASNKDGLALKSIDQLKSLYAKLDPGKETIVYCQSGVRSAETVTVLKELGFKNVKIYESSWLGYGNIMDAPAENVTYFNVGALNARLTYMQRRMDALERMLEETRARTPK